MNVSGLAVSVSRRAKLPMAGGGGRVTAGELRAAGDELRGAAGEAPLRMTAGEAAPLSMNASSDPRIARTPTGDGEPTCESSSATELSSS